MVLGLDSRQLLNETSLRKTWGEHGPGEWDLQLMTPRKQAAGSPSTYLSLQQKPCKVLVAVNALREVHLDGREWPAHAVWRMGICDKEPMSHPSSQAHQRNRRARVTSSGTCPRAGYGLRVAGPPRKWPQLTEHTSPVAQHPS